MSFLNPENYVEGQGLLDNVDVLIKEARVELWDYNGKVPVAVPALKLTLEQDGGEETVQFFSLGKATDWQPSEDGMSIVAIGKAQGIASNSNAALFLGSLVNAGFPANKISDNITFLEGLKVHVTRIPAPKRGGIVKAPREDGRVFEDTVLTVETIISMPGKAAPKAAAGKPQTAAAGAAKPAGKPAAAAADFDVDARCTELLIEALAEKGEAVKKSAIPGLVMKSIMKDPNKNAIITRIYQDTFLSKQEGWTFDNGMVSLG